MSDEEEITFKETIYEADVVLFEDVFKFKKDEVLFKEFEIVYPDPIKLQTGVNYEIASQYIGSKVRGNSGDASKQKSGPFTFSNTRKSTNSTSSTGGQFRAFIVLKKI